MPKRRVTRHEVTQPLNTSYRFIPLTKGQNAIVDVEDFEQMNQWNWCAHWNERSQTFYATRNNGRDVKMHRVILGCKKGEEVDHINHNGLDNRKSNLRKCSSSQNSCNRRMRKDNTSGIKGVYWYKLRAQWKAQIQVNGKNKHLGFFSSKEEAAQIYSEAAKKLHGEFAFPGQLNYPAK